LGLLFPIYGKIKNVPNHQPDSQYDGNRWNMFWNMMEYDFTLLDIAMFHIVG
jgi:hypothetical protein